MGKEEGRLAIVGLASVGLVVGSLFGVDWFVAHIGGLEMAGIDKMSIDLRSAHTCTIERVCASVPLSMFRGAYPTAATVTFWSSLGFGALIALQTVRRVASGAASDSASKFGYLYALYGMAVAFATGYLFGPEGTAAMGEMSVEVERTWGPAMLVGGHALGLVALYLAIAERSENTTFTPTVIAHGRVDPAAAAPAATPTRSAKREIPDSLPLTDDEPAPRPESPPNEDEAFGVRIKPRTAAPPAAPPSPFEPPPALPAVMPAIDLQPAPPEAMPALDLPPFELPAVEAPATAVPAADGPTIAYAVSTVRLSPSTIDAQRTRGGSLRVQWQDVVGAVVRRLPAGAPYDGAMFVDIVSTAGATIRILPATAITGEQLPDSPDERARAIVRVAIARQSDLHLDRATREFLKGAAAAAQLPDADALATHDARLA